MLNLNSVMVGTQQVNVLATFYEKVFGRPADMTEGEWYGWKVGDAFFSVGQHSQMVGLAKEPGRLMFNLETDDVQGEFDRIKELGTIVVKEPYEMSPNMWIATFADPDGNYFQLMSPWKN